MRLLIPKENAIKILQNRISELDNYNFNVEAWKERTVLDLKEIFPPGSTQFIKIQFLRFDTYVSSEKLKVFEEAKRTAKEILNSYILFIEEHSRVAEDRKVVREKDFEEKYSDLMKDRNEIVTEYNALIKSYEEQLETDSELLDQIENLRTQIESIRRDTIQIDNVSLLKLSKAFFNLPIWQIVATFSVVVAIVIGSFELGKLYQGNSDNNQLFDYKMEITKLKDEKSIDTKTIKAMDDELKRLRNGVDSLQVK